LGAEDGDPFVLDVQPAEDYEAWHVPGSTNIDIAEELRSDPEAAREALRSIPSDEVVLTCAAGEASKQAADHLRELGYEVRLLSCLRP
jgi:rhodanese-related sulfurtransferase